MRGIPAAKRDALNTTIDIINDNISTITASDPRLSIIRPDRINRNIRLRRDGLHLDEKRA